VALVVEDEDCLLPVGPETRQHQVSLVKTRARLWPYTLGQLSD